MVRTWCVLYILTWKCASRHNGVHFFISHLASWVRTRRFSEPTFRPSGATNHWKNTVNRDFPTFSRICIFFLLIFSLLTLLTSAFQLSILSEVSLLNFLRLWENRPFVSIPFLSSFDITIIPTNHPKLMNILNPPKKTNQKSPSNQYLALFWSHAPWIPVDPRGSPWIPVDPRGSPWCRASSSSRTNSWKELSDASSSSEEVSSRPRSPHLAKLTHALDPTLPWRTWRTWRTYGTGDAVRMIVL